MHPTLYLWKGVALINADFTETSLHSHHAIQLTCGYSGNFSITIPQQTELQSNAVVLDADTPHLFRNKDHGFTLFIYIEPESLLADAVRNHLLKGNNYRQLDRELFMPLWQLLTYRDAACRDMINSISELAGLLQVEESDRQRYDERVLRALSYIRESLDQPLSIKDLASSLYLSESRLMHLIAEQTGMPFRKHVHWARLFACVKVVVGGANLSEASLKAGFSDQAHFTRTFVRMFGIPPGDFLKDSRNVQAFFCESG
ncbi:helix-turn-helix domain-containing protein [Natronogracilivirga saccharolytica]|uniref:Helix-turn-helix transcriptional regulator n=1 Tax=Natronogracilivirga saccharolytica TaxID=2812953 RepID=A0A8J7UWC5_9BACT|nr:AraC family transcriptional regulator [Natronogracilivirga saccharolytica]MBP3192084.1 helix-turn-helix transcriptional regulator [Natronogracilivirga saccharolytica]